MTIGYVSQPPKWERTLARVLIFISIVVLSLAFYERYPRIKLKIENSKNRKLLLQAKQLIDQGQHTDAREILNRLVTHIPDDGEAWELLARSWEAQEFNESFFAYSRTAFLDKGNSQAARKALKTVLSNRHFFLGDVVAVEFLRLHPSDVETHILAARILAESKRFSDAYNVFLSANLLNSQDQSVLKEKTALLARGVSPQSLLARQQLSDYSQHALTKEEIKWFLQANATADLSPRSSPEKRIEALNRLQEALEIDPDDWALRLRWFSLLREFAPDRVNKEIYNIWELATSSGKPGRQLSTIYSVLDISGIALSFIRKLPDKIRRLPEAALIEIIALSGIKNWNEIISIANFHLLTPTLNPYHRVQFLLWSARATQQMDPTSLQYQSFVDQARIFIATQSDPLLALNAATLLNQWGMQSQALPFLNMTVEISTGEIRGVALRGLSSIPDMLDSKRLLTVLIELHKTYPKDPVVAAQTANVFLKQRFNLPGALTIAELAYRFDPGFVPFADVYARALAANNRRSEALSVYKAMPPSAFDNPEIRRNMMLLETSGALSTLPANLPPNNKTYDDTKFVEEEILALEEVRSLALYNKSESLDMARRIFNVYPNNPKVIVTYAALLVENGDCDQALHVINSVPLLHVGVSTAVSLEIAQIFITCQQPDKSLEILDSLDTDDLNPDQKELYSRLHSVAQKSLLSRK